MDEETRIPEKPTLLLDRYRIDGMLGEGGLGTVYKAYDTRLKRTVAIKTLKRSAYSDDPDMFRVLEERFQREAEAGSRMHVHPNLVVVHDFVTDANKSLYLVQEFVPGGTLADRLAKEGALPQGDSLRLAADIARGLSAAHEMHIVHRDIKPANIFLSADGRARVGDFGIAQLDDMSNRTRATAGHPGTPLYMSPEQASSSGYVRAESDQYSLGLVLFEMLTEQTYKRLRKRQAEELLSHQPEPIQSLVRKMTADDPDDRFDSMMDVATEIGRIERQLASAATSEPSPSLPKPENTAPASVWEREVSVDYEPTLTQSKIPPQIPQTEQETRRETPRVNLRPMAAAKWQPPPAVPAKRAIGRRSLIIASSILVLFAGCAVVIGMMRDSVAPSATATLVAAVPTAAPSPIASTPIVKAPSAVAAFPVVAATSTPAPLAVAPIVSSTPQTSPPTPVSPTSMPQDLVAVSDPSDYCAKVGNADFRDFDSGSVRFVGTPPVSVSNNQPLTPRYWRCYGGKVLVCDGVASGYSLTCGMADTSDVPPQRIIDFCASAGTTTSLSLATQGNSNYIWTCDGGKPVRGNQLYSADELDEFGYIRKRWYSLESTSTQTPIIKATATLVQPVKPVTVAPAAPSQPSASYPGKIVYATTDEQIWVTDADGNQRVKVGNGESPVFSPDGKRVAYVCQANPSQYGSPYSVCTVNLDGSNMQRQCEVGAATATGLARWSPGGRFIAVSSAQNTLGIVQMCDVMTGKLLGQLKYSQGSIENIFDWAPDGNNAVWQSGWYGGKGGNLYYGDPNQFGQGAVQLTNGQNQVSRIDNFYSSARISPDGKTIAVAGANVIFLSVPGQHSPLDGWTLSGLSRVTTLAWSPDGKALAYMTFTNPNLWTFSVVDIESGKTKVITSGAGAWQGRVTVDWSRQ